MKTLLSLLCAIFLCISLKAQPGDEPAPSEKKIVKQKSVLLRTGDKADSLARAEVFTMFPNIGRIESYLDRKQLDQILALEKKGRDTDDPEAYLAALDPLLEGYVRQFGIRNFGENVSLLWLLGRTKERRGDTARAVMYYELAKIHNYGTPAPKLSLDSLLAVRESEWLPADKYFELLEVRRRIDSLIPPRPVLTSMGKRINSPDPDYAPFMHPSDSVMIFTSRRDTSGMRAAEYVDPFSQINEDLYYAEVDFMSGEWTYARKFSEEINSQYNEGSACLAPDGKTLFFTRCRTDGGYGDCDLYTADYNPVKNTWENIQNLGKNVNSSQWDSQPNISADGKTLFFSSNRRGGFGGSDLYMAERVGDTWSPAQNLGPFINTPRDEVTPFYHKINHTLYFSSTGQITSFGGFDIYKSRWLDDHWERPKNVGPLVNKEEANQYYFAINGKGTTIFYANSNNPDEDHVRQNFDLYSFPMPMEARPDAITTLRGRLVDSVSGHALIGTVLIYDMEEEGVEVAPKITSDSGYYAFDLIGDRRYKIVVLGDNFLTVEREFVMKGDTTFSMMIKSFEVNKPLVFESLEFRANSAKLSATLKPQLDYIVRFLQNYPMFKLVVEGHTDADGAAATNQTLSEDRARAIRDYLTLKGKFDPDRISSRGWGETQPIVPNDTEEHKRKNRRVEFKLVLDAAYDGDMFLPSEKELYFDKALDSKPDPEHDKEFDWGEEEAKAWEEELEGDEDLDLDKELEEDILRKAGEEEPAEEEEEEETEEGGGGRS